MPKDTPSSKTVRPPIIVIMGHIDHGKSSLLDYIRKTNVTGEEAGGITQHLGAYEATTHDKKITFIDTPGHAAFTGMRERGAQVADIAILIISAVEGVQTQTLEALSTIKNAGIPFIVALNKIDRPEAQPDRVKQALLEHEVFVEGYGGTVPCVAISAKSGQGVDELLDTILLLSDLEDFKSDANESARGVVIESHLDPKRGAAGILVITDGTMKSGSFIVIDDVVAPVRILENFLGKPIKEAGPSAPVRLASLGTVPKAGSEFITFPTKKEAEKYAAEFTQPAPKNNGRNEHGASDAARVFIPLILKTDTLGTLEAVTKEFSKLETPAVGIKIVASGAGAINESDIKSALSAKDPLIIGFHVKTEKSAVELAEMNKMPMHVFDIIYKATEMLEEEIKKRTPKVVVEETLGTAKILKTFSKERDRQIVGGAVLSGVFMLGKNVKLMRHDHEIGRGKVLELQQMKQKAKEVEAGKQFGAMIESKMSIAEGDTIEVFDTVEK
jgi:translation initiation factor IF-2